MTSCECEHISHFGEDKHIIDGFTYRFTPNGNPAHCYAQQFSPTYLHTINTRYGRMLVCKDCRDDCHGDRYKISS